MTASPTDDLASAELRIQELIKELSEAREQQAATADILAAISSSPTDPRRVFTEIAASAARLCDAYDATIHQVDGDKLPVVAHHGSISATATFSITREFLIGRAVLERRTIHIADLQTETEEYPLGSNVARRLGFRTILAIPLIRASQAMGVIAIRRTEARPFTDRQIELLKTFADQAVIAIENTRLFEAEQTRTRELSEALEQQTATSEVLKTINSSTGALQPLFQVMLANAMRVCEANFGFMNRYDGDTWKIVATHGGEPAYPEYLQLYGYKRPGRETVVARIARTKETVQVVDLMASRGYMERDPVVVAAVELGGVRTLLGVPMLKEDQLVGAIMLYRQEVRPFNDKQITLVQNFAAQAVIAIENTRLLSELRESLQQQTATADVLKVISRSTFNLQSV